MPHASEDGGAAGEDACSSDELIVFKDEDGGEDVVKRSSDKVTEEKSDLIDLSETEVNVDVVAAVVYTSFPYCTILKTCRIIYLLHCIGGGFIRFPVRGVFRYYYYYYRPTRCVRWSHGYNNNSWCSLDLLSFMT